MADYVPCLAAFLTPISSHFGLWAQSIPNLQLERNSDNFSVGIYLGLACQLWVADSQTGQRSRPPSRLEYP